MSLCGQRQSQSPESVAPNVRVRNPIGQSQSPVNTSTGCRETRKRRQRVSNRESATPRKPGGGSRNLEENRKSTTKSHSPLKAICLSVYLSIYLRTHGNMEKRNVNNKKSPSRNLNATLPQSNLSKAQTNPQANPDETQLSL